MTVSGTAALRSGLHVDIENSKIKIDNKPVIVEKYIYLMLRKPPGYVSSTRDSQSPAVLDLVPEELRRPGLFPVGRLDKDTEGLLILTDDGAFAHAQTAPFRKVPKTCYARVAGKVAKEDVWRFSGGWTPPTVCVLLWQSLQCSKWGKYRSARRF